MDRWWKRGVGATVMNGGSGTCDRGRGRESWGDGGGTGRRGIRGRGRGSSPTNG